jgi:hypothetical protein
MALDPSGPGTLMWAVTYTRVGRASVRQHHHVDRQPPRRPCSTLMCTSPRFEGDGLALPWTYQDRGTTSASHRPGAPDVKE